MVEPWQIPILVVAGIAGPLAAYWAVEYIRDKYAQPVNRRAKSTSPAGKHRSASRVTLEAWRGLIFSALFVVLIVMSLYIIGEETTNRLIAAITAVPAVVSAVLAARSLTMLLEFQKERRTDQSERQQGQSEPQPQAQVVQQEPPPQPDLAFELAQSLETSDVGVEPFSAVVWVSDAATGNAVKAALVDMLSVYELNLVDESDEHKGSWWQRLKFQVRRVVDSQTFTSHRDEAEQRLTLELVEKTAAEVNKMKTDSAAALIAATDKSEQAVVIFGQTVIVKFNGTIIVRSVNALTAAKIERTYALLSDPEAVVRMLSRVSQEPVGAGGDDPDANPPHPPLPGR